MQQKMFHKTQPKRHRVLLAISLALTPLGVYSQSMLDEVVVSASRSEQKAFDAHGSIDVVNRQTIERSGPQINLSEALGMTPLEFLWPTATTLPRIFRFLFGAMALVHPLVFGELG